MRRAWLTSCLSDEVERELNRRIKLRFDREGLELARRWPGLPVP